MPIKDHSETIVPPPIAPELLQTDVRQKSVLLLDGTGVSMWHYLAFLRQFSLQDLSEFAGIYGISGGAASSFIYGLSFTPLFDETRLDEYDQHLRAINKRSLPLRCWKLLSNDWIYDTQDLADSVVAFTSPEARNLTFREFPLQNYTVVGFDDVNSRPILVNSSTHPEVRMVDALASVSLPRRAFGRRLCRPIPFDGFGICDLAFTGTAARQKVMADISGRHNGCRLYVCNLFRHKSSGQVRYLKFGRDRLPGLSQYRDLLLFFLNLPNPRLFDAST